MRAVTSIFSAPPPRGRSKPSDSTPHRRIIRPMGGSRAAYGRRALASVAASVSLHLLVGVGTTSLFLGGTLGAFWQDPEPLMVEIIAGEEHARSPATAPPKETRRTARPSTRAVAAAATRPATPTTTQPAGATSAQPAAEPTAQPSAGAIAQPAETIAEPRAETTVPPGPAMVETVSLRNEPLTPDTASPAASLLTEAGADGEPLTPGEMPPDQRGIPMDDRQINGSGDRALAPDSPP